MNELINKKIRIIKICSPFFKKESLGKIDYIERISDDGIPFLRIAKMNVNFSWIEFVDDLAEDIHMEINESSIISPVIIGNVIEINNKL